MRTALLSLALILVAAEAHASDATDVMSVVRQSLIGNPSDLAKLCAPQASIMDEFPPYHWQGRTACAEWAADYSAFMKKEGITDAKFTLEEPRHVDISGDTAYVVLPVNMTFKTNGQEAAEKGAIYTLALKKLAAGWRITGWSWAKP